MIFRYGIKIWTDLSSVLSQCTRIDRQTDRQTEFSLLDSVCILCSAVKNNVYKKNGYRRRSSTSETANIRGFVRFVMYCIITTVPVAFYWHCSDGTLHYKSDKTVNFCGFRCATTSLITVFINVVFTFIVKNTQCQKALRLSILSPQ